MKIEIWSDVMCPFCYIGKRHFEQAVDALPFKKEIEVEWKSYQLDPEYKNTTNENVYEYLSRRKGFPVEQAKELTGNVELMAANAGLQFDMSKNIPANTFDAHRLIHLAAKHGLQDLAEEKLFEAHFIKGADIGDKTVLLAIAGKIGLSVAETEQVLDSDTFAEAVRYDIYESQQIGVRGVPFFVLDRKYAISGAQPVEQFKEALTQSFTEWKATQPKIELKPLSSDNGAACGEDGCVL